MRTLQDNPAKHVRLSRQAVRQGCRLGLLLAVVVVWGAAGAAPRRVLILDPGEPLRAGAVIEVLLLPGILDVHAAPLEPPAGAGPGEPARVLRWRVSPGPVAESGPGPR